MSSEFEEIYESLLQSLPPIVARHKVPKLTGGLVASGTLANHDWKGTGPENPFMVGRWVHYTREALVAWLKARTKARTQRTKKKAAANFIPTAMEACNVQEAIQ
jgi:hypothetical protein